MCFGRKSTPPPPPPPPAPVPMPTPAPTPVSASVKAARVAQKRTAAITQGRKSTILTGPRGVLAEADIAKKTLLGA